jgi:hypothetical protein
MIAGNTTAEADSSFISRLGRTTLFIARYFGMFLSLLLEQHK